MVVDFLKIYFNLDEIRKAREAGTPEIYSLMGFFTRGEVIGEQKSVESGCV